MVTTGAVAPMKVSTNDVELPTTESVVEQVESIPTDSIEIEQVAEEVDEVEVIEEIEEIKPTVFKVTAYCPCAICCGKTDGITATGVKATQGRTIAVDPKVIPYGTEIIINGNTYVAEDCGGAIKGNRIDMYFDSHQEALKFGVQYLEGVIVK